MRRFCLLLPLLAMLPLLSCRGENKTAILWADRPEFAFYGEYFNASQDEYKVEVKYFDFPAQKLKEAAARGAGAKGAAAGAAPDIVAASWLKGASTRAFFKPLDKFLAGGLPDGAFYPRLLAMGNIEGRQYLLPVSFNAPVVVFARDRGTAGASPFTISFEEMKKLGKEFNVEQAGVYTRMGFSPLRDDDFLFIAATLFNVSFREASPLAWDAAALERAIRYIVDWTASVNTGVQAEEDFTFKYFYEPPEKLALSGRILFTCMDSDEFFVLAEERRNNLDFRWLAERNTIPLAENSVYLGLLKKGRAPKAAAAFVRWFFQAETQRAILETGRRSRMNETSFGIGGGFSALRSVTGQIFPLFYPGLLGHMPPEDFLSPPAILPSNWTALKLRVILPYLHDRVRLSTREELPPLERRIADWMRVNR